MEKKNPSIFVRNFLVIKVSHYDREREKKSNKKLSLLVGNCFFDNKFALLKGPRKNIEKKD